MQNAERDKMSRKAIEQVVQLNFNKTDTAKLQGQYRFKFFRMGVFEDVIIDDFIPSQRRAAPHKNEWWVPLCEKAYAKFWGSYDNINGGWSCWALTDLTGGIALQTTLNDQLEFDFLHKLQNHALMCTANLNGEWKGLVNRHSYTVLRIEEVSNEDQETVRLVKLRNPHGTAGKEWSGIWKDKDRRWDSIRDEDKQRIGYKRDPKDGEFWMTFDHWVKNFEGLDICLLPKP